MVKGTNKLPVAMLSTKGEEWLTKWKYRRQPIEGTKVDKQN